MAKKSTEKVTVGKNEVDVEVIPYNDKRLKKYRHNGYDAEKAGLPANFKIQSPYAGGGATVNVLSGDDRGNAGPGNATGDDGNTASPGA